MQYRCEKWNHKTVIYTIRTFPAPAPPDTYYIVSHGIATNSPKPYKYSKNRTTKIKKENTPRIYAESTLLSIETCPTARGFAYASQPALRPIIPTLPCTAAIRSSPSHPRRMPSSPASHWPRQVPSGS